jgi:hypothetical protein
VEYSGVHGWSPVESSGIDLLRCNNHRSNRGVQDLFALVF